MKALATKSLPVLAALTLLASSAGGCAFMGDAFKRQGARREAAKARAAKKFKVAPKPDGPP